MTNRPGYILAVDGGQSHSLAILATRDGRVLAAGKGGPANHFLEDGGEERFRRSMTDCIHSAFQNAGLLPQPVLASHYCLTGVHDQMASMLQQIVYSDQQTIAPDKEASLVGSTLERPAVLVLAGTGAIAYGQDALGNVETAGGWGYVMGDEGSASWIVPRALSAVTRAEDGRGRDTTLRCLVTEHFHVLTLMDLHHMIYVEKIDRVAFASAARVVGDAAQAGDAVALQIMTEAGCHLGDAANAIIRKLRLETSPVTITTAGGVFKAGEVVLAPMMARIHSLYPLASYTPPSFPPVIGALFLALKSIGVELSSQVIENVRNTETIWGARK